MQRLLLKSGKTKANSDWCARREEHTAPARKLKAMSSQLFRMSTSAWIFLGRRHEYMKCSDVGANSNLVCVQRVGVAVAGDSKDMRAHG